MKKYLPSFSDLFDITMVVDNDDKEYVMSTAWSPELRRRLGYPEENLAYGVDFPFEQVFRVFHNAEVGHHGVTKTADMMRAAKVKRFNLISQVCEAITKCDVCQKTRSSHSFRPAYASLAESTPFRSVHIDHIVGLTETLEGFNHILVMVDSFTGFICLKACKPLEAAEVVTALEELFVRFGGSMEIRSDNHQAFNAVQLAEICALINVRRRFSTAYVSTSNGKVERMNQEVQRYLAGFRMENYGVNLVRNLPLVEHIINSTVSLSRGFSPFLLMFGREAALRNDLRLAHKEREESDVGAAAAHLSDLERQLVYLHEEANRVMDTEMIARARSVDLGAPRRQASKLKKVMLVLSKASPSEKSKMAKTSIVWLGPFEVVAADGDTFVLRDLTDQSIAKVPSRFCKIFCYLNGNSSIRGLRLCPGGIDTADKTRAAP